MKRKKLDRPILAEGEVTGHAHVLDSDVDVFEMENGTKEFSIDKEVTIIHEEHKPIKIPAGDWVSDRVVEYDHLAEEARKVVD